MKVLKQTILKIAATAKVMKYFNDTLSQIYSSKSEFISIYTIVF